MLWPSRITALSRFKELFVIARNSSFVYKGRPVDIQQVARELGVRYVLEGSVRKVGARVRITGQLVDAATRVHLWADRFDGAVEDVFELQDRITESVLGALLPTLRRRRSSARGASPRRASTRMTTSCAPCPCEAAGGGAAPPSGLRLCPCLDRARVRAGVPQRHRAGA